MRFFSHLLDLTIINSWLLCKRIKLYIKYNNCTSMIEFRKELSLSLCKIGTYLSLKCGLLINDIQGVIKKGKMSNKTRQHTPPKT